jgi:hypothetical protein
VASGPSITAKFLADTSGLTSGVDKAAGSMADSLGGFAKKAAAALAGAFVVDKIIDFGKASVEAAAADAEAQDKLAQTLKNVTGATDAQIASSEDFISGLSKQAAIADDDLRPAYDRLVRGFGNAEDAQKALALATDVSAGTGKDLSAVTEAMGKAAQGNTGALKKMGIAVQNADGSAKSLDQIMGDMAKTFSGQAAVAADSTAGKMRNAQIQFGEFQESIGARLLPVVGALAGFFTTTLLPALDSLINTVADSDAFATFSAFISGTLVPALQSAGEWFANVVSPAVVSFISGTLVPALQSAADWIGQIAAPAVADFFTNTLVPALQTAADWIGRVAAPAVADFFTNSLIPALKDTAGWLKDTLVPALQEAKDAVANAGAFQGFVVALEAIGKVSFAGLVTAIGFIKDTLIPTFVSFAQIVNDNKDVVVSALGAVAIMLAATVLPSFIALIPTAVGLFGIWVAGALSAAAATALAALPFVLIGLAIAALILLVIRNWDTIVNATKVAFDFVKGAVEGAFNWISENWPLLLAVLTGPIGIAVLLISRNWDTIKEGATAVWQWIQEKWEAIKDAIGSAINFIKSYIDLLVNVYFRWPMAAVTVLVDFITDKFNSLVDIIRGVVDQIGGVIGRMVDVIKAPINALFRVWNGLELRIPRVDIPEWIPVIGGKSFGGFTIPFPDLPQLAKGGVLTGPTLFMGGESGTEIVAPEELLRAIVSEEGSRGNYTLNLYPRTADSHDVAFAFRRLELLAGVP